ncbi:MAG TPA: hypothetical protein ENG05_00170 [Acidilobales archaeon]|nr:hypothetical protein [Acidilobales archaeon]
MASLINEAIELYNRFRAPEAKAKLVKIERDKVYVLFEGTFCETCGINDWVEDFKYVLEDLNAKAELEGILEPADGSEHVRIGIFKIKS